MSYKNALAIARKMPKKRADGGKTSLEWSDIASPAPTRMEWSDIATPAAAPTRINFQDIATRQKSADRLPDGDMPPLPERRPSTAKIPPLPQRRANGGHVGALRGATGGRADDIQTSVPDGSHIIPADVVSALGDGNTEAGFAKLEQMFPASRALGGGISGMKGRKSILGARMPRMPKMPGMLRMGFARGGAVPVKLSDGEFPVTPEHVARVGGGDVERGHLTLDRWTVNTRKADIERRKKLPGPVGSGL